MLLRQSPIHLSYLVDDAFELMSRLLSVKDPETLVVHTLEAVRLERRPAAIAAEQESHFSILKNRFRQVGQIDVGPKKTLQPQQESFVIPQQRNDPHAARFQIDQLLMHASRVDAARGQITNRNQRIAGGQIQPFQQQTQGFRAAMDIADRHQPAHISPVISRCHHRPQATRCETQHSDPINNSLTERASGCCPVRGTMSKHRRIRSENHHILNHVSFLDAR